MLTRFAVSLLALGVLAFNPAIVNAQQAVPAPPPAAFPVTFYILEGTFTLELEGRAPLMFTAGQAYVEPPNVKMTGYNRSATEPMRVVIVYVSDPATPFLDSIK